MHTHTHSDIHSCCANPIENEVILLVSVILFFSVYLWFVHLLQYSKSFQRIWFKMAAEPMLECVVSQYFLKTLFLQFSGPDILTRVQI